MATIVGLMDRPIRTRANPRIFAVATLTLPKVRLSIRDLRPAVSGIVSGRVLAIRSVMEDTHEAEENVTLYSNRRVLESSKHACRANASNAVKKLKNLLQQWINPHFVKTE